jgi:hypothetical protein
MPQPQAAVKPRAIVKHRRVVRNKAGTREKVVVVHEVASRRARYAYEITYPRTSATSSWHAICDHSPTMADDQDSAQDIYDLLVGTTIEHGEYSGYIGNCHVDIVRPGSCRLMLNVWCEKVRLWHRHEWPAGGPLICRQTTRSGRILRAGWRTCRALKTRSFGFRLDLRA